MDIFDEIIECLNREMAKKQKTPVDKHIFKEFFATAPPGPHESAPTQSLNVSPSVPAADNTSTPIPELAKIVTLAELKQLAQQCRFCRLHERRRNVVFGEGNPHADLMFIGEGPGADEDIQGRPFVGKAGQLLTKMINAMQFTREQVYIANIVKCHPPGNRNPEPDEAACCLPYLERQIALIAPKVIVTLGAVPLKYLFRKTSITRERGRWLDYNHVKVMPTFHPAFLLRKPAEKRAVWEDLQQVMKVLGKNRPG